MAIVAGPIWPIMNIIYFDVYFMSLTFLQHDADEKVGENNKNSFGLMTVLDYSGETISASMGS